MTPEALRQVEAGEDALRALGFRQMRVRHHGAIARIEIARDELARALTLEMAAEFTRIFKQLGFKFVTLDLEGFRSGSMNAVLPVETLSEPLQPAVSRWQVRLEKFHRRRGTSIGAASCRQHGRRPVRAIIDLCLPRQTRRLADSRRQPFLPLPGWFVRHLRRSPTRAVFGSPAP